MSVRVQQDGVLDAVMMTWDLALHGDVTYSTRYGLVGTGRENRIVCMPSSLDHLTVCHASPKGSKGSFLLLVETPLKCRRFLRFSHTTHRLPASSHFPFAPLMPILYLVLERLLSSLYYMPVWGL